MGYDTISIKDAVNNIRNNTYLLPAIQREMVWDVEQIENLFDSAISGYPLGLMLFWKCDPSVLKNYKFYHFLKKYDEQKENHCLVYSTVGQSEVTGVLDGQQRLTAFYLGLCSSLKLHKARTKWGDPNNFEEHFLYINLLYRQQQDEDSKFEFRFKTEQQAEEENKKEVGTFWYKIGNILDFKEKRDYKKIKGYSECSQEEQDHIGDIFDSLYDQIMVYENINYFLVQKESLDEVLNIFVRINSGGTKLDYTDFLMSLIVNHWTRGRDGIHDALDNINLTYTFDISKDAFLRGLLFLTDANLKFCAENFKKVDVEKIQKSFANIKKFVGAACKLFNKFGYNKYNLQSNLIIMPVAYYLMKRGTARLNAKDEKNIKRWIQLSILNRVFSSHTTSYQNMLRAIIKASEEFPLEKIMSESEKQGRSMNMTRPQIESLVDKAVYGSQDAWAILTLLNPDKNYSLSFEEDHIYPKSELEAEDLRNGGNYVANLQLLESSKNQEKGTAEPEEWLKDFVKNEGLDEEKYRKDNLLPSIPLVWDSYEKFIAQRRQMIIDRLCEILRTKE